MSVESTPAPGSSGSIPGASAADPPGQAGLDGALVRGLAWTGSVKWASQVVTWASTLIVARILSPEDYGLVSMASVYLGVVTLLSEFGLGAAVVMLRTLDDDQIAQMNGFAVLMGLGSLLVSIGAAYPLGAFFRAPQLPAVVIAMSTVFVITSFRVVPGALLQRDLRFKDLAINDGVRALLLALAMVTFAALGFGYWTLVLGALLSSALTTVLILRLRRHGFAWPRVQSIRHAMVFSGDVVVSRIAWYLYANADFLVAGRVLGKGPLGGYSVAWTLASVPVEKVSSLVIGVTPAVFSAVQDDLAALRRYLLTLTQGIALITFPAAVGLSLVADDFVHVVLTAKWEGAIIPLRVLALYATLRSVSPLFTPVLNAIGETRFAMWNNVLALLVLPTAFYFGSHWGTPGIALAWMIGHPPIVALLARRVFRRIELPAIRYLGALWPAVSGALAITLAVFAMRAIMPDSATAALRLAVEVAAGASAYAAILLVFHRERLNSFRRMLARIRR